MMVFTLVVCSSVFAAAGAFFAAVAASVWRCLPRADRVGVFVVITLLEVVCVVAAYLAGATGGIS
jgi:hypothetical protein